MPPARKGKKGKGGPGKRKKGQVITIGGVSVKQLTTFTRQFSTLQDAGLPVLRSLRILEHQIRPGVLKNALIDVVEDVESGSTLSEAFGKHPKCFDRLYVNMVKAGEAGGALEVILKRLADFKEKAQTLKRRVIGAMVYPVVVITVAVADPDVHHDRHHSEVQKDLRRLQDEAPLGHRGAHRRLRLVRRLLVPGAAVPARDSGCSIKLIRLSKSGAYALDRMSLWIPIVGKIIKRRSWPGRRGRWARWSPRACRSSKR